MGVRGSTHEAEELRSVTSLLSGATFGEKASHNSQLNTTGHGVRLQCDFEEDIFSEEGVPVLAGLGVRCPIS